MTNTSGRNTGGVVGLAFACVALSVGVGCVVGEGTGTKSRGAGRPDGGTPPDTAPGIDAGIDGNAGPKTCAAGEHLENATCVSNVRACSIANGVGEQTWADGKYGNCVLKSCSAGYQRTVDVCTPTFVGKFRTPCGFEAGFDYIYTNDFMDDSNHVLVVEVFKPGNGTCSSQYKVVRQIGTYKRIGLSATAPGAVKLDFYKPQFEVTLLSDQAVSDHNAIADCKKTDWKINTKYLFPRADCVGDDPPTIPTINKVDGDKLYIGDFTNVLPGARPQKLNVDPAHIGTRIP